MTRRNRYLRPAFVGRLQAACALTVLAATLAVPSDAKLIDLALESPTYELIGARAEDNSGASVLFGDVDGDGRDDLIVAAPGFDYAGRVACGALFIVIASDTLPSLLDFDDTRPDLKRVIGPAAGAKLGSVMACADIDNDGRGDIVCGIPGASPMGRFSAGELYLIFGSPAPADTVDLASATTGVSRILGAAVFDKLGTSLSVGDVDDDTFGDILAGAPLANTLRTLTGKVVVIKGSASLPALIDLAAPVSGVSLVFGAATNDFFGGAVLATDVTGDGIDDIVAGAPESSPLGRARAGTAYVIPGGAVLADTIDTIDAPALGITQIFGEEAQAATGSGFTAGDFDGDALRELAVGAPEFGASDGGAVYLVSGLSDTIDLAQGVMARLDGDEGNANVGLHLDTADFDLDGRDDIAIGVPNATASIGRDESGRVYIVLGRPLFAPVVSLPPLQVGVTTINGAAAHDRFGSSVATGRLVGAGVWDLLVGGENLDNPGELRAGAALLFLGGDEITGVLSYDAIVTRSGVQLTWELSDPVGEGSLRIERRSDGDLRSFGGEHIARLHTRYVFIDSAVKPGRSYSYTVSSTTDAGALFSVRVTVPTLTSALLEPAFPNPFSSRTTIPFWISAPGTPEITVYDVKGARVRTLGGAPFPGGPGAVEWDGLGAGGRAAPSGVYFVRLKYRGETHQRKLLLLR